MDNQYIFPVRGADAFSQTRPACVPVYDAFSFDPEYYRCVCSCGNTGFGFGVSPTARVNVPQINGSNSAGEAIGHGMYQDDGDFRHGRWVQRGVFDGARRADSSGGNDFGLLGYDPSAPPFVWTGGFKSVNHLGSGFAGGNGARDFRRSYERPVDQHFGFQAYVPRGFQGQGLPPLQPHSRTATVGVGNIQWTPSMPLEHSPNGYPHGFGGSHSPFHVVHQPQQQHPHAYAYAPPVQEFAYVHQGQVNHPSHPIPTYHGPVYQDVHSAPYQHPQPPPQNVYVPIPGYQGSHNTKNRSLWRPPPSEPVQQPGRSPRRQRAFRGGRKKWHSNIDAPERQLDLRPTHSCPDKLFY